MLWTHMILSDPERRLRNFDLILYDLHPWWWVVSMMLITNVFWRVYTDLCTITYEQLLSLAGFIFLKRMKMMKMNMITCVVGCSHYLPLLDDDEYAPQSIAFAMSPGMETGNLSYRKLVLGVTNEESNRGGERSESVGFKEAALSRRHSFCHARILPTDNTSANWHNT